MILMEGRQARPWWAVYTRFRLSTQNSSRCVCKGRMETISRDKLTIKKICSFVPKIRIRLYLPCHHLSPHGLAPLASSEASTTCTSHSTRSQPARIHRAVQNIDLERNQWRGRAHLDVVTPLDIENLLEGTILSKECQRQRRSLPALLRIAWAGRVRQ